MIWSSRELLSQNPLDPVNLRRDVLRRQSSYLRYRGCGFPLEVENYDLPIQRLQPSD